MVQFSDRAGGMDKHLEIMTELRDITSAPINPQFFGNAGREHMEKYGDYPENTKHVYNICTMLGQRRRRWAGVILMIYKCFVFDG